MSPAFTGGGDEGYTGMLGPERVPKYHLRMEALGALDEATATLGLARSSMLSEISERDRAIPGLLVEIQRDIYRIMAETAAAPENALAFRSIDEQRVAWLEGQIQRLEQDTPMPGAFIVPGDTPVAAALDLARTVIRRAERRLVELTHQGGVDNPHLIRYLNRLSSLCFLLEIVENQSSGKPLTFAKG